MRITLRNLDTGVDIGAFIHGKIPDATLIRYKEVTYNIEDVLFDVSTGQYTLLVTDTGDSYE